MKALLPTLLLLLAMTACDATDGPVEHPRPMPGASPFEYPVGLWDERLEGETVLMVHVTELGHVDSAYVSDTSGYAEFDSAAVTGVRQLRFVPGRRGERRVAMWIKVPVRFALDTTAAAQAQPMSGSANR